MDFLNDLNSAQREAVEHLDGPSLVIAGAGSGKTRVLTYKVANLLLHGVPAYSVLALTFTNKAAREMKERITNLVGDRTARYLWMGTFHSICARILRQDAEQIGYTHDFTIYDTADQKSVIKSIIKDLGLDDKVYKVGVVQSRISMAKNNLMTPHDYAMNRDIAQTDRLARLGKMAEVFQVYNNRLRSANAMDFDDLLFYMCRLLADNESSRQRWQTQFKYILVDEYQDTNYVQSRIVSLLAQPENNVCVVGDDAQSIYSFRGANIDNILHFQEQYPSSRLYKLERNYRSTQNIVNAANSLIKKNVSQIPKDVYSEKSLGELLHVSAHQTDREEAAFITKTILKKHTGCSYQDFAVLYRTNSQSRVIEDELRKRQVPYRLYGSVSFYQRKEIKDAIAYFRLVVNPQDEEALLRVINFPARGIGDTTMNKVTSLAHSQDISPFLVVANPLVYQLNVSSATAGKLTRFAALIDEFRRSVDQMDAYDFARKVLNDSQIMITAAADKTPEGQDRYENLQELLSSIHEFVEDRLRQGQSFTPITEFLSEVSLLTDQDENLKDETPRVTLMTVHAAKGLEFPYIFIAGMEEKLFPSMFAETQKEIEEERRLFYVAITRAELECYITYAKQRFRNGSVMYSPVSRFLKDIDEQYLDRSGEQSSSATYFSTNDFSLYGSFRMNHSYSDDSRKSRQPYSDFSSNRDSHSYATKLKPVRKESANESSNESYISDRQASTTYNAGTRLRHATFGDGTVVECFIENGNEKVIIDFDNSGRKTLLLRFAKLDVI